MEQAPQSSFTWQAVHSPQPTRCQERWGKVTGPGGAAPGALPLTCLLTPH